MEAKIKGERTERKKRKFNRISPQDNIKNWLRGDRGEGEKINFSNQNRKAVSKKKNRYTDGGYDLDLSENKCSGWQKKSRNFERVAKEQ